MPIKSSYDEAVKKLENAGSPSPNLDARFLLAELLNVPPSQLNLSVEFSPGQEKAFLNMVTRRSHGEPVSKILGKCGFYGREFMVNREVLDPRADSETLIELALKYIKNKHAAHLLDIGTGSGCLIITLLCERPALTGVGVDVSEDALLVAKRNAALHKIWPQVEFETDDFSSPSFMSGADNNFDIIISNPPYIRQDEKLSTQTLFDPPLALFAGQDGLDAYRNLAHHLPRLLKSDGLLFLEIGQGQEKDVASIMQGFVLQESAADLAGITRALCFKRA